MENIITALVIGKSGTGKSEFILSFIDEDQRRKIPASGEGQTTRTSMKYEIDFREKKPLVFVIDIKKKSEFIAERMSVIENYFKDQGNSIEDLKDNDDELRTAALECFEEQLIFDDAFFNCREFDSEGQEDVSEMIQKLFRDTFSKAFWGQITEDFYKSNEKEDNNSYEKNQELFESTFSDFLGKVYEICRKTIPCGRNQVTVAETSDIDMGLYLKVGEDGKSYSALIKSVSVTASGNKLYHDMMERNKIDKLILIDTYGLDHAEQIGKQILEARYRKLLREEYPDVKSVFYLRNISVPGSPSDLQLGITTLFKVEPSIVPYVIFTFWDKIFSEDNADGYKNTKAFVLVEKLKEKIELTLRKEHISGSLIEKRIKELLDTRIAYASVLSELDENTAQILINKNIENIRKILHSVRFKNYLGSKCIPVKKMDINRISKVLSADQLFKNNDYIHDYQNSTKGAIRRRIQPLYGRVLGFDSTTHASVLWSDIIADDLNTRFSNVIKNYDWKKYLESEVNEEDYPEIIHAIEEIFLTLSRNLYWGSTNSVEYLNTSHYGDLIIKSIYDDRKDIIDRGVISTVSDYLTNIYQFGAISEATKAKIQDIINRAYLEFFIPECRKHNARKVAELITEDTTWTMKEEILNSYFSKYENDNITEEEKMEFESLVSDYMMI